MVACFALALSFTACSDLPIAPEFEAAARSLSGGAEQYDHTLTAIGDSVLIATPKEPTPGTAGTEGYWAHPNDNTKPCPWNERHPQRSRCVWVPGTEGDAEDPTFVRLKNLSPTTLELNTKGYSKARALGAGKVEIATERGTDTVSVLVRLLESPPPPGGSSTWIYPGEDIQQKVKNHPAGTTFHIKAGVHRLQQVTPKDGQSFIGEPGAVLNGAKLLTGWTRESGRWWVEDRDGIRSINTSGGCQQGYPRCQHPVELFINDEPLRHVASLAEVGAGTWFFDYEAGRIYVGSDPMGKTVERSLTARAFDGSARNVTIRNLQIEKYATRFQEGAIHGNNTDGWMIEDNVIQLNHGVGVRIGHRMLVRRNQILRNGQLGIGGIGDDVLVEGNKIAYNNFAGVRTGWEAGASKFVKTRRLVVRGNHVHHNAGKGLWTDIDNIHTLYENNVVEDNGHQGIFHEISYDAVIRNNIVRRNGFERADSWIRAAGIFIANSPNVEIYGNLVEDNYHGITAVQQARGSGAHGPYLLRNLWVHDNTVRMQQGRSGVARDDGDSEVFSVAGNNRFDRNSYQVASTSSRWFAWDGGNRDWSNWRGYGQDKSGRLLSW